MIKNTISLFLLMVFTGLNLLAQISLDCSLMRMDRGVDIMNYDVATSCRYSASSLMDGAEIVFCPAGIERSSPDDIKKRWSFDWKVKFNNIYIRTKGGIVLEGMNAHGFSASVMYLENSMLPKKNKKLIPIAASLAVNFYIDHFKSIDTALLAVWDTRIFDDIGSDCGWPFRIILHDSTGATAYVEFIEEEMRVFTPEAPSVVTSGSSFTRLVTIRHTPLYEPQNNSEKDFLYFDHFANDPRDKDPEKVPAYYQKHVKDLKDYIFLRRDHENPALSVRSADNKAEYKFREMRFPAGKETTGSLF